MVHSSHGKSLHHFSRKQARFLSVEDASRVFEVEGPLASVATIGKFSDKEALQLSPFSFPSDVMAFFHFFCLTLLFVFAKEIYECSLSSHDEATEKCFEL